MTTWVRYFSKLELSGFDLIVVCNVCTDLLDGGIVRATELPMPYVMAKRVATIFH